MLATDVTEMHKYLLVNHCSVFSCMGEGSALTDFGDVESLRAGLVLSHPGVLWDSHTGPWPPHRTA